MLGPEDKPLTDAATKGVIPQTLDAFFIDVRRRQDIASCTVSMSYFELYMEEFVDLLSATPDKQTHKVVVDPSGNVTLSNMSPIEVPTLADALALVQRAQQRRSVGAHEMNKRSSRSHTILSIIVDTISTDGLKRRGKLNLVDLAGSESLKKTKAEGAVRFQLGTHYDTVGHLKMQWFQM